MSTWEDDKKRRQNRRDRKGDDKRHDKRDEHHSKSPQPEWECSRCGVRNFLCNAACRKCNKQWNDERDPHIDNRGRVTPAQRPTPISVRAPRGRLSTLAFPTVEYAWRFCMGAQGA